jgi:hypothetical protein
MKLKIKRDQAQQKGLFGGNKGVSFSVSFRVDFSSEEKALIEKYKLGDMLVATYERLESKDQRSRVDVDSLGKGFSTTTAGLGTLQELEDNIVDACKKLKNHLAVASTFGGEDEIDI